ncbi:hypothetical protein M0802_010278 [Mischocyttarus mexicanus]|nr:hypothetical protein M0802_010278 [Mischocyttarus mexicanus]
MLWRVVLGLTGNGVGYSKRAEGGVEQQILGVRHSCPRYIDMQDISWGLWGLSRTSSVSHGRITTLLSFGKWQAGNVTVQDTTPTTTLTTTPYFAIENLRPNVTQPNQTKLLNGLTYRDKSCFIYSPTTN